MITAREDVYVLSELGNVGLASGENFGQRRPYGGVRLGFMVYKIYCKKLSPFHQLKFVVRTSLQTNFVYLRYFKLNSGRSNNQVAKVKGLKNSVPLPVEKS